MKLLQVGEPKSGNFWLWRILQHIQRQADLPRKSLVRDHPIHDLAVDWELSHDRQADIDMLSIQQHRIFWRISSIFRMPVDNPADYVARCDHVWSHSQFCDRHHDVLPHFDRVVYIIRDPRNRLLSAAEFAFTDYMQKFYPHDESSPKTFVDNRLEAHIRDWTQHVRGFLSHARRYGIYVLFYERLLHDFDAELDALLDFLDIDLNADATNTIKEAVSFSTMRQNNPGHVRKGHTRDWRHQLTAPQQRRVLDVAGDMLERLNYPLDEAGER